MEAEITARQPPPMITISESRPEKTSEVRNTSTGALENKADSGSSEASIAMKKRKLTLDLSGTGSSEGNGKGVFGLSSKKAPLLSPSLPAGLSPGNFLLASPDLQMLKISSPELERLIIQNLMSGGKTPTPSTSSSKTFAEEHDAHLDPGYVKGYCDAFKAVQQSALSPFAPLNLNMNMAPLSMPLGMPEGTIGNFSTLPLQIVSLPAPPPAHNGQNPQTPILPTQFFIPSSPHAPSIQLIPQILLSPQTPNSASNHVFSNPPKSNNQVVLSKNHPPTNNPVRTQHQIRVVKSNPLTNNPPRVDNEERNSHSPATSLSPPDSNGQRVPSRASSESLKEEDRLYEEVDRHAYREGSRRDIHLGSDEEDEEKLMRKRERNRLAAARCRERKLNRISELQDRVKDLASENEYLAEIANGLRNDLRSQRLELADHLKAGCKIEMPENIRRSVEEILHSGTPKG